MCLRCPRPQTAVEMDVYMEIGFDKGYERIEYQLPYGFPPIIVFHFAQRLKMMSRAVECSPEKSDLRMDFLIMFQGGGRCGTRIMNSGKT